MNWLALITLGTIWGASYLLIKVGAGYDAGQITPLTFVAGRVTIAAVAVAAMLLARRERFPALRWSLWWPLVVMGFTNGVIPYLLITWGETQIPSGLSGILVATMPIFTMLFAHWMTNTDKLNTNKIIGILIGFAGVVVLFLPDLQQGITLSLIGSLVTVVAAVSYGFATAFAHRFVKGVSNFGAELGQMVSASVVMLVFTLSVDHPWTLHPSTDAIMALVALGIVNTAFAYLIYYWLIDHSGPTSTSLVTYISPVTSVLLGALILHETFDWTAFVGFAGIVAGVTMVRRGGPRETQQPVAAEAE